MEREGLAERRERPGTGSTACCPCLHEAHGASRLQAREGRAYGRASAPPAAGPGRAPTSVHSLPREGRVAHAVQPLDGGTVEGHGQHAQRAAGRDGPVRAVCAVQEAAVGAGGAHLPATARVGEQASGGCRLSQWVKPAGAAPAAGRTRGSELPTPEQRGCSPLRTQHALHPALCTHAGTLHASGALTPMPVCSHGLPAGLIAGRLTTAVVHARFHS